MVIFLGKIPLVNVYLLCTIKFYDFFIHKKIIDILGKAHLKKHTHIWDGVPTGGGSDRIPTSLTDLAKWQR